MQQSSTNQHFHNLQLSYQFYKLQLINNLKALQEAEETTRVQDAASTIVQMSNYLVVKDCLIHHSNLKNCYLTMLEVDWKDFFDYYELLDALISDGYNESQWSNAQSIITCEAKYQSVLHFGVAFYALRKLQRLIPIIFFEMYRDQYGINHYQNLDLEILKEKDFLTDEMIYVYLLEGKPADVIEQYIGYEEKRQQCVENAANYFKSIELVVTSLYESYGDEISKDLDRLLTRSYFTRLNFIAMLRRKGSEVNWQEFSYDLSYESFFNFSEFFTFRLMYPDILRRNEEPINNRELVERDTAIMVEKFGPKIEERYRNLYCYLIMVENLLLEYMQLYLYVKTGAKDKIGDLSLERALQITQANFIVN